MHEIRLVDHVGDLPNMADHICDVFERAGINTDDSPFQHITRSPAGFLDIAPEIVEMMILNLDITDVLNALNTCRYLRQVTKASKKIEEVLQFKDSTRLRAPVFQSEGPNTHCKEKEKAFTVKTLNPAVMSQIPAQDGPRVFSPHVKDTTVYNKVLRIRGGTRIISLQPEAACLQMQVTQPPSTDLIFTFATWLSESGYTRPIPNHQPGPRARLIHNDKGITLGDIREQAVECIGVTGTLSSVSEDELFLTASEIAFLRSGNGVLRSDGAISTRSHLHSGS